MREILFRAKQIDNGEWVEGFYSQLPKPSLGATIITNGDLCAEDVSDYIIVNECKQHSNFSNGYPLEVVECEYYEIDSETLCQYTGLKDKNGNRIWENDIVKGKRRPGLDERYYSILFDSEENCLTIKEHKYGEKYYFSMASARIFETVGNIFDTPELLKGE